MYDDIATNEENPKPGTIINHPDGQDIYTGVPKDYTGSNITVDKFLAVLLGDKNAVKGGSGKVVDSGPNDHIFVFYLDHGGPGVLGMPTPPYLFARDLLSASSDVGAGPYVSIGSYGYFGLGGYGVAGAVAGAGSLYGLPSGTSGYDRGVSSGLSGYPSTLPGVAGTGLFPGSTLPGSRSYLP